MALIRLRTQALAACLAAGLCIRAVPSRAEAPGPAGAAVVVDPAHHCLITAATVGRLLAANTQSAHLFGVAPPAPSLAPAYSAALKSMYPGFDEPMKATMAEAERNVPQGAAFLSGLSAQQLAAFEAPFKKTLDGAPDEASRQVMLTQVLAHAGQHAGGAAGNPALHPYLASRLREQTMMQNSMTGASRSYSPSCNVATGTAQANPIFCQPR